MGVNTETGADVYVHPRRFERHPHVALWGAPGVGKTIKILQMFAQGLRIPRASWIILNIKGGLGRRARDLAIARGQAHRLEILDPGEPEHCAVYSPTHPNSLSWATHAKQLREGIRESTNMSSFDVAQQMARVLFMFLALTRLFDLTFVETVALMRPKSALRKSLIRKVPDPELKAALQYFDSLPERRQDEIATSSMARLESFAFDPTLKAITCQKGPSIDIGAIIDDGKIFIADIREYDPLRVDDARMLLRFIVNDVVAHVFARLRSGREITPVYLICDEAAEYMTTDLCRALDLGREPGLHVWLAAQYPDQFLLEDGSTRIRDSVMGSIENHLVFRLANVAACKAMAQQIFFDRLSTHRLKHELTGLEQEMVEEERTTYTQSRGGSHGTAMAYPESESVAESESETMGLSRFWTHEFEPLSTTQQREATSPILNKVGQFLMAPPLRHIVGQGTPRLDIGSLMDGSGIFIANLGKGRIGEHHSMLLGSLLIAKFFLSALKRADRPAEERPDFFITADELHNLASDMLADILSEARKYHLSLTGATQYLEQLSPTVRSAILANVGTMIVFRVGPEDARLLEPSFAPRVTSSDLQATGRHEMYIKLGINDAGVTLPFHATSLPPMTPGYRVARRERIIQSSRERWGARRETVEDSIAKWLALQGPVKEERRGTRHATSHPQPPSRWWKRVTP